MKRKERLQYQVLTAVVAGIVSVSTWGGQYGIAQAAEGEETSTDKQTVAMADYGDEDVVVTAAAMPTKIAATPANVTVITAQEIEDNHYQDMAEALEHVNGVTVVKLGGDNSHYVELNGDERVVVLLNGRRLNQDQGSVHGRASVDLNMIPTMANIERIEVIKGGASALYGSDAVGGVINIITKKHYDAEKFNLDVNTGSWKTRNYNLSYEGTHGDFSWFVYGGLQKQGYKSFKFNGKDYSSDQTDGNSRFSLQLNRRINDRSSVDVDFNHSQIEGYVQAFNGTGFGLRNPFESNYNNVSATYNFKEGTAAPGFIKVYHNYQWIDNYGSFNTTTNGVAYQNGWQLDDKNVLIAGAEWRDSNSDNVGGGGYKGANINTKAIYIQDTYTISDKWNIVPGLRLDNHSSFGNHWTPKIAVNFTPDAKTQLFASWSRIFKAPTADDMYYNSWGYVGNPNLLPETGYTESIGINYKFTPKTSLSATYFKSEIHNKIDWINGPGWSGHKANNVEEKKQGLELLYKQKIDDNWSYDVGYTYLQRRTAINTSTIGFVDDTTLLQPNGYKFGVNFKKNQWKANLYGRYASGLDKASFNDSGFHVWDFNVSYDFNPDTTVYLKVNNIFNNEYYVRSGKGTYYPGTGRFIQVGLNVKF